MLLPVWLPPHVEARSLAGLASPSGAEALLLLAAGTTTAAASHMPAAVESDPASTLVRARGMRCLQQCDSNDCLCLQMIRCGVTRHTSVSFSDGFAVPRLR